MLDIFKSFLFLDYNHKSSVLISCPLLFLDFWISLTNFLLYGLSFWWATSSDTIVTTSSMARIRFIKLFPFGLFSFIVIVYVVINQFCFCKITKFCWRTGLVMKVFRHNLPESTPQTPTLTAALDARQVLRTLTVLRTKPTWSAMYPDLRRGGSVRPVGVEWTNPATTHSVTPLGKNV